MRAVSPNTSLLRMLIVCLFGVLFTGVAWSRVTAQSKGQKIVPLIGGNATLVVSPSSASTGATGNSTQTYAFNVANTGTANTTGAMSIVQCSGAVSSCSVSPTSASIAYGKSVTVTVTYHTAATGTGTITLNANWPSANNADGTLTVNLPNAAPSVTVSPNPQYTAEKFPTNDPNFSVQNSGTTASAYTLATVCSGNISACSVSTPTASISAGASVAAIVYYTTGPFTSGNGTATLTATSTLTGQSNSTSVTVVPLSSAVTVGPKGGATSAGVGANTSSPFTVTNVGNSSPSTYTLSCAYSGVVTSCSAPATVAVSNGSPQTVNVSYTTSGNTAGGTGTVTLTATASGVHTYTDQGSYNVTVADARTYTPVVTPKGNPTAYNEANVSTNYVFAVKNSGDTQAIYTLTTPTCTGTVGGCTVTSPITVNPGQTASVPVNFTTGASGQTVGLDLHATMSAHGVTFADDGSVQVVPTAPTVTVTPLDGTPSVGTNGSSLSYHFQIADVGNATPVTYTLQVTGCVAPVTNCSAPSSVAVTSGSPQTVVVSYNTTAASGTGSITLRAFVQYVHLYESSATASVNVASRLRVSTAFMNNDDQDVSLCAASCFAMTAARSTVPYYSLDTPRSVALVYNGDRAFPRPFVYADVSVTSPPATVQAYKMEIWRNGARLLFTNGDATLVFQPPSNPSVTYRLAGQLDMSSYPTGVYPVQVIVTAVYANSTSDVTTVNTQLLVVNTQSSGVAKGWTVGGIPRLYVQSDSSAAITDGAGSALYFAKIIGGYGAASGDYTTLRATSSNGGWVRTSLDSTKVWFGSSGLADSVTDRLGYNTQFMYDASQRLIKIYDPFLIRTVGATRAATVLTYGTTGLQSIQEANPVAASGRITYVRVDASGLLRSVVDPTNTDSTTYGYDTSLRLNAITDRNGHTTTYSYDSAWKIAQITAPAVPIDASGGGTTMQQPTTLLHSWQAVGVPTAPTGSNPAVLVNPDTIVARVTDAKGYTRSFSVNRWGQPMSSTDPLGNVTQYQRSGILAYTQTVLEGAGVNEYTYSGAYLTMAHQAGSDSVNYHYGVAAQIDSTWGFGTVFQRRFLRSDGRADSVEYDHSTGRIARYSYDPVTKAVSSMTDPAGHTTSYSYDATFGNLTEIITPGGRYQMSHFDAYGRDTVTLAPGVAAHYTRYDNLNRPVFDSVAGNGGATRMSYPHDTLTVTDAKGQVYRTDLNALGWATAQHHPDGTLAPITNRYDKDGRLTSTTNRRGQMITLTYDALGRVLTRSDPVSGVTSVSYSAGGFRTVASNATIKDSTTSLLYCQTGTYAISYGCNSDTTVVTLLSSPGKHYTMGNTTPGRFDQAGTSTADDGTGFTHLFMRNSLGLADSVTLGPLTMKYVYDQDNGLLTTTSLPNTSTRTDQYTRNNEVYNWTYTDTAINPLYRRSYRVDLLGRVTSEQMGYPYAVYASSYQLNREAAYDSLGHVAQVNWSYQSCMAWPGSNPDSLNADQGWRDLCSPSAIFSESYTYDAVGNRKDSGAGYNLGNTLTSVSWAMYVYDADGNVTSRTDTGTGQLMKFYWDAGNELDSVLVSGGGQASYRVDYRYDPYGRQVWRSATNAPVGSGQRLYLYNGSNITKEVDLVTGNTTEYQYSGVDHPTMSVTRDSTGTVLASRTYMMDGLGNVVGSALDGSTGAAIIYDSWGNVQTDSTAMMRLNTLRFGFKGMLYDETTGLYNARARWYQPDVGRFMSEDPLGLLSGVNQYVFAADDPIDGSDPSGALATDQDGSACSINADSCGDPLTIGPGGGIGGPIGPAGNFGGSLADGGWSLLLPNSCKAGLQVAGASELAVVRASSNWGVLSTAATGHSIDPSLLGAIGIRESGFQDVNEKGGKGIGVGVFQLTVTPTSGVTAGQANDLAWAANYAAAMLQSNVTYLANKFPKFTQAQLLQATAASYNLGPYGISGNPNTIDVGSAPGGLRGNYGSNVVQLMTCF